ncbi:MAG: penicillin-binding protein 2 [Halothiobacillaceae bacterium]
MSRHQSLLDSRNARAIFNRRVILAVVISALAIFGLLGRAAYLQVVQYEHFQSLADKTRIRVQTLPPERGRIFDRHGRVVADNEPGYQVELIREDVPDLEGTLALLASVLDLDEDALVRLRERLRQARVFDPVLVKANLTERERAELARYRPWLPGVDVVSRLTRVYPYRHLLAHVVGYVGRVSEQERARLDPENYRRTDFIGKTGIERYYEERLHGRAGYRRVEVDAFGRVLRVLEEQAPIPGEDLVLSLDVGLQGLADAALGRFNGSVVALDPRDGAVRALVSKPGFDPNLFVGGISVKDYRALLADPDRPLYNRAVTATYPPGSTIKMLMGLAGLDAGLVEADERFFAGPFFRLPGHSHRYRDWRRGGHGWVDLDKSIAKSVDVFFYDLAHRMGIDAMHRYLTDFGLGVRTGIDLPGESRGLVPSRGWKQRVRGQPWYPGETVIAGIGQGYMLSTALQLASMTVTLANRGERHRPWLLAAHAQSEPPMHVYEESHWQAVLDGMKHVIHSSYGTARRVAEGAPYELAGKTGTAQVFSLGQDEEYDEETVAERLRDHALFVGYAPFEEPKIAVSVIAENGGSGSGTAAPIARKVMDAALEYYGYRQAEVEVRDGRE